jgi:hypothetical protein
MPVSKQTIIVIIAMILFVVVPTVIFALVAGKNTVQPGQYDALAVCLTEKNTKMYGAYWCAHCQNQKKMFGDSFAKITYIECSLPGGAGQTEECAIAGINGYPTWEFADGSRLEGEVSLEVLAQKSNCSL